jgi:brefeldin A-resistance guanine nucleotide exchange factor 1
MADGGYLVPPSQDVSKEQTWTETKKRLERFLPDLFKEIFPEVPPEQSTPVPAVASPVPSNPDTPTDEKAKDEQPSSNTREGDDANDEQKE